MAIISVSAWVVPPPAGADITTTEGLKAAMGLFEPKHFLMSFLAHALGTFVGAFVCAKIAVSRKLVLSMVVGCLFFAGGLTSVFMLPSPLWFSAVDLLMAYFPMAFSGWRLAQKKESSHI